MTYLVAGHVAERVRPGALLDAVDREICAG
jgi:hypothetical protein